MNTPTSRIESATPVDSSRAGFSLTELMIAGSIMTTLMAVALGALTTTMRQGREGMSHVRMIDEARTAEQNILKIVQGGRAISASGGALMIMMPDDRRARIRLVDDDATTIDDNHLEYDPDLDVAGDQITLCEFVTELPGEPLFQMASSRTALIAFHVGEVPEEGDALMHGQGYQGVEVRASATPRNLGTVY